jgi:hypothetical protein
MEPAVRIGLSETHVVVSLPSCAAHRSTWFGHAPGVKQFGNTFLTGQGSGD